MLMKFGVFLERAMATFMYAGKLPGTLCCLLYPLSLLMLTLISFSLFSDARSMAKDVHNIILKVVQEKGKMSEQEAIAYVKKMEAQKRYSTDVWS